MTTLETKSIKANRIIDQLYSILIEGSKQEYFGENISQLEHSLQAAEFSLSLQDSETTIAALLHDIGQFLDQEERSKMFTEIGNVGVKSHDKIGEQYLRKIGFSEKVCILVGSHVNAKRYLTGKDKSYFDKLSEASKASLKCQGGPYTLEQVTEFEKGEHCQQIINMRLWDDKAKIENYKTRDLEFYRPMIVEHLLHFANL